MRVVGATGVVRRWVRGKGDAEERAVGDAGERRRG